MRRSLAGLPAVPKLEVLSFQLIGEVFRKLFEVVVVKLQVDEMYFLVQVLQVLLLLVGCRVGVAVRASPLQ